MDIGRSPVLQILVCDGFRLRRHGIRRRHEPDFHAEERPKIRIRVANPLGKINLCVIDKTAGTIIESGGVIFT